MIATAATIYPHRFRCTFALLEFINECSPLCLFHHSSLSIRSIIPGPPVQVNKNDTKKEMKKTTFLSSLAWFLNGIIGMVLEQNSCAILTQPIVSHRHGRDGQGRDQDTDRQLPSSEYTDRRRCMFRVQLNGMCI